MAAVGAGEFSMWRNRRALDTLCGGCGEVEEVVEGAADGIGHEFDVDDGGRVVEHIVYGGDGAVEEFAHLLVGDVVGFEDPFCDVPVEVFFFVSDFKFRYLSHKRRGYD